MQFYCRSIRPIILPLISPLIIALAVMVLACPALAEDPPWVKLVKDEKVEEIGKFLEESLDVGSSALVPPGPMRCVAVYQMIVAAHEMGNIDSFFAAFFDRAGSSPFFHYAFGRAAYERNEDLSRALLILATRRVKILETVFQNDEFVPQFGRLDVPINVLGLAVVGGDAETVDLVLNVLRARDSLTEDIFYVALAFAVVTHHEEEGRQFLDVSDPTTLRRVILSFARQSILRGHHRVFDFLEEFAASRGIELDRQGFLNDFLRNDAMNQAIGQFASLLHAGADETLLSDVEFSSEDATELHTHLVAISNFATPNRAAIEDRVDHLMRQRRMVAEVPRIVVSHQRRVNHEVHLLSGVIQTVRGFSDSLVRIVVGFVIPARFTARVPVYASQRQELESALYLHELTLHPVNARHRVQGLRTLMPPQPELSLAASIGEMRLNPPQVAESALEATIPDAIPPAFVRSSRAIMQGG